jgi:hypothetical protein
MPSFSNVLDSFLSFEGRRTFEGSEKLHKISAEGFSFQMSGFLLGPRRRTSGSKKADFVQKPRGTCQGVLFNFDRGLRTCLAHPIVLDTTRTASAEKGFSSNATKFKYSTANALSTSHLLHDFLRRSTRAACVFSVALSKQREPLSS